MNITYMLDTNTVSYIVKGQSLNARAKLEECSNQDDIFISAITEAEIRFGIERRQLSPARRAAVENFVLQVDVLPWDSSAATSYSTMRAKLQAAGKTMAAMDLLIAAHADSIGAILVTNDQAFQYPETLVTANWATDLL